MTPSAPLSSVIHSNAGNKRGNRLPVNHVIPFVALLAVGVSVLVTLTMSITSLRRLDETTLHLSLVDTPPSPNHNNPDIALRDDIQKPQLVIHVGPPKTATTTIQQTLTLSEWKEVLATDNYLYTGVFLTADAEDTRQAMGVSKQVKDFDCSRAMSLARASHERQPSVNRTLHGVVAAVPCAKTLLDALEQYRLLNQSLIVSDESLGFKAYNYTGIDQKVALDWISLASLLKPQWDVSVVVVYRRYFDWLPSSKQQMERWTPRKPKMNKWTAQGGKVPGPLFPKYWMLDPGHALLRYFFADYLVPATRKYLPVSLVNLHHPGGDSARSIFICQGLPGAKHSCRTSRARDKEETKQTISNPSMTTMYDTLVMAADAAGILADTSNLKRREVALQAMHHHRDVLNGTWSDFAVVCPEQDQYQAFLNKSLSMEKKVLPDFFSSPHGEAEHREQFWKAVNKGKFCHIDTAKVLEDPRWTAFFAGLTTT